MKDMSHYSLHHPSKYHNIYPIKFAQKRWKIRDNSSLGDEVVDIVVMSPSKGLWLSRALSRGGTNT